jgi:hypothetical protein
MTFPGFPPGNHSLIEETRASKEKCDGIDRRSAGKTTNRGESNMRARLTSRFSLLFMMTFALMLALPAVAFAADATIVDGDGLAPLADNDMDFGTVCSGVESSKSAPVFIKRNGQTTLYPDGYLYIPPDVFVGSYEQPEVQVGGYWSLPDPPGGWPKEGLKLSAKLGTTGTITLPSDWVQKPDNTQSASVPSTVTLNSSVLGPGSAKIYYSAYGWNSSVKPLSSTDTLIVSWKTVSCDTTAPTVSSITRANANPTNASSVSWNVTFSESVSNVGTADFALANTGLTGPSITGVTGSGANYTVTANTGSGDGSLGLKLVDDDSIIDGASNKLGGTGTTTTGNGSFTGEAYTIDKTKPVISGSSTTQPGGANYTAGDWTNKDVAVSFSCLDSGGSAIDQNTVAGDTLTASGADQSVTNTGTCTDKAGNVADSATFSNIDIDKVAPEVTLGAASGTAGSNGWYISAVAQRFNAADALSGIDGATFQDKTSSGQGSSVSITSDAFSDKAGNTATGTAGPFKIDLSDPTITTSLSPANPASSGWYNAATEAPTVGFTCSDSVSGLATACPADYTFANGANQSHEGTVTDRAGRSATTNVNGINVDLDAPSAPVATTTPLNPVANSGGFFKDTVTVSYGGSTDVGPSGIAGYSDTQTFPTTDTHNYSGTATDKAGNVSTATTGSVKVDADAPTVGITGCPTSPVLLNSAQSITVAAGDVGSGLVSNPSGSVSLDTSPVGSKTKTITVADKVGHSNSATCSYSVKYGFTGFLSPIPQSSYIAGSTIPVKFGLTNAAGARISDAAAQALVASPCKVKVSFNSGTKNCAAYNATTDTFQFDVKTPKSLASGLYNIVVEVSAPDGSGVVNSETVRVNIRH